MIQLKNVSFTYPFADQPALRNVSLHVRPGEVVLCTGVSGSGKTTLMRLVNGLCTHHFAGQLEGQVLVNGFDNQSRQLHEIAHDVGTLFQDPEAQFFALNVEDEMAFALEWQGMSRETIAGLIDKQMSHYDLNKVRNASIHQLSEGQKQKLGLAGVTIGNVKALILDEPTANLDPEATQELALEITRLKNEGLAILIVDHRLYWLKDVADRVVVFNEGCIVAQGDFAILSDTLRAQYGLRNVQVEDTRCTLAHNDSGQEADQLLRFENMSFAYKNEAPLFEKSNLVLTPGISAIIGSNGAGKTTLSRILTGLNQVQKGEFFYKNRPIQQKELLKHVVIVLQNADHQLHMKTVAQEILSSFEAAKRDASQEALEALLTMFDLQELAQRHPQSLSGGQKQRLVIACAIAKQPDVILLDEPTSGLDGINMKRIARVLKDLTERGAAVLVITHDLELMNICCTQAILLPLKTTP